jgi:hypothetical protein
MIIYPQKIGRGVPVSQEYTIAGESVYNEK